MFLELTGKEGTLGFPENKVPRRFGGAGDKSNAPTSVCARRAVSVVPSPARRHGERRDNKATRIIRNPASNTHCERRSVAFANENEGRQGGW